MPSPLAVSPDFDALAALARTGAPGLAAATLKVQAELFIQHDGCEPEHFAALTLMLLPQCDDATARLLAHRLAPFAATPQAVLLALFARSGGVAESVLELAQHLPANIRAEALTHHDPRLAARLAARNDLTDDEQMTLLDRNEGATILALARNQAIAITGPAVAALIALAPRQPDVADALFARSDVSPGALLPLYRIAVPDLRAAMRTIAAPAVSTDARPLSAQDRDMLMDASIEGVAVLVQRITALAPRGPGFGEALIEDISRELLALALVGLGAEPACSIRMLLRTGDDVAQDTRRLGEVVAVLRGTTQPAAEAILAAGWPRQAQRVPAQHVPFMAPGGTPSRAMPGQRRPVAVQVIDRLRTRT